MKRIMLCVALLFACVSPVSGQSRIGVGYSAQMVSGGSKSIAGDMDTTVWEWREGITVGVALAGARTVCFPLAVSVLLLWLAAPPAAQEKHLEILHGKLQAELDSIVDDYEGVVGAHLVDLTSGDRFGVNDELLFPQASAIKVPILLELFRRAESEPDLLRRRVDVTDEVRTGGSGVLRHLTDGGASLPGGPRDLHERALRGATDPDWQTKTKGSAPLEGLQSPRLSDPRSACHRRPGTATPDG